MKKSKFENLHSLNTFLIHHHLNDYFSLELFPYYELHTFDKGDFICKEGDTPRFLYYMIDGKAKLYVTLKNGKIALIDFLFAPIFIGEIELIGVQSYTNGIQSLTKSTCFAVPIQECKSKLLCDTKFLHHICYLLGTKVIRNTENFSRNQAYPLLNRLARFILMTQTNYIWSEKNTEVAEYLGVSYRHLLYVLSNLCHEHVLQRTQKGYSIQNYQALEAYACEGWEFDCAYCD